MAKTKKKILDELEINGSCYRLYFEYYPDESYGVAIYHRPREAGKNKLLWRLEPRKSDYSWIPHGYEMWESQECCSGRKQLFRLAREEIEKTRTTFRIRGGWQPQWTEVLCGDQYQDTVSSWRERCMAYLKQQLGDRETEQ